MRSIGTANLLLLVLASLACNAIASLTDPAVTLIFAPVDSTSADANSLEQARAVVQHRLDESLAGRAMVTVAEGQLTVELWNADDAALASQLATGVGTLVFFDSDISLPEGAPIPGYATPLLTDADIDAAQAEQSRFDGQWQILITMTQDGEGKLADITTANIGRYLIVASNGFVIFSPVIHAPILDGRAQISGDFDESAAKALAAQLNSGRLPFELELVEAQE